MKDYLVYHNPDLMGGPVKEVPPFSVVTNKKVGDANGSRVWLLTGEGSPRVFFIRSYFIIDQIESGADEGFETRLSGDVGECLNP